MTDVTAETRCEEIAKAKGLNVKGYFKGKRRYSFVGNYWTKGCYFYKGGDKYDGYAFYGRGGTKAQLVDPGKDSSTFERIPIYFFESCIKN